MGVQRSPGAEPRWESGGAQKPETNANFQLRRGDMTHVPPWLCHWFWGHDPDLL